MEKNPLMRQLALMTRFDCNVCGRYCPTNDRVTLYDARRHAGEHGWKRACIGYSHKECCNWRGSL